MLNAETCGSLTTGKFYIGNTAVLRVLAYYVSLIYSMCLAGHCGLCIFIVTE